MADEKLEKAVSDVEKDLKQEETGLTEAEQVIVDKAEKIVADEELENKTTGRLAKAFGEKDVSTPDDKPADKKGKSKKTTPDEELAVDEDEPDESTPKEDEDKPADESGDEDVVVDDEDVSTDEKDESEKDESDESTSEDKLDIPEPYVRAAIHSEWTLDEIRTLAKKDPELALKTCKKLYDTVNKSSAEFASFGRKRITDQVKQPVKKEESKTTVTETPIDLKKLKEEYGDDPLVDVVEKLVKRVEELTPVTTSLETKEVPSVDQVRAQIKTEDSLRVQLNTFFADDSMKLYNEFYGIVPKGEIIWDKLTTEQQQHRWDVINLADQICHGAISLGKEITVEDAMNRAHLSMSQSVLEKAVRDDLKKKVKSRTKTLQPKSSIPVKVTAQKSEQDLETKVAGKLTSVFGKK
jgi:hypothetical protein